ncbi:condensation domain-containing protein [Rummeliibacillus stabekisii]|uniref:condensation domain-containing protein n=1 Tax=Rummeliibacillus stabekisii TaxID=241244 RepID=UPI00203FF870|nr:condensation domain-containing protein [Rummeliibacillus stabekisii]MCM3318033.1 condensation domain-containing protein [Rummeliibacillus stabekisii]
MDNYINIYKIICRILNEKDLQLTPDTDFYEIGGDSMLAVELIHYINSHFDTEISLGDFLENTTPRNLMKLINSNKSSLNYQENNEDNINSKNIPLLPTQESLMDFEEMVPKMHFNHLFDVLRIKGTIESDFLEKSINNVLRRHDALRASFDFKSRTQIINEFKYLPLRITEVNDMTELKKQVESDLHQPFNLESNALLIRFHLIWVNKSEYYLNIIAHHLIIDGYSLQMLEKEIFMFYKAYLNAELPQLDIDPPKYKSYVIKSLKNLPLTSTAMVSQPIKFPQNIKEHINQFQRKILIRELNIEELNQSTLEVKGITLFQILFSQFALLLALKTKTNNFQVSLPILNRNSSVDIGTMGNISSVSTVNVVLDDNTKLRDLIDNIGKQIKQTDIKFKWANERNYKDNPNNSNVYFSYQKRFLFNDFKFQVQSESEKILNNTYISPNGMKLMMNIDYNQNKIIFRLDYQMKYFDENYINELIRMYELLLSQFSTNIDLTLNEIAEGIVNLN